MSKLILFFMGIRVKQREILPSFWLYFQEWNWKKALYFLLFSIHLPLYQAVQLKCSWKMNQNGRTFLNDLVTINRQEIANKFISFNWWTFFIQRNHLIIQHWLNPSTKRNKRIDTGTNHTVVSVICLVPFHKYPSWPLHTPHIYDPASQLNSCCT